MTIRNSLLALLTGQPAHGYALKSTFEATTAGTWTLNIGQVYTTLDRLERDGLIEAVATDETKRRTWRITDEGRTQVHGWYETPVVDDPPARDELAIKVLLAVAAEDVDLTEILQRQREATMNRLQEYTRHKRRADPEDELAWLLMLDALVLKAEAELRWLDLCEQRLDARGMR